MHDLILPVSPIACSNMGSGNLALIFLSIFSGVNNYSSILQNNRRYICQNAIKLSDTLLFRKIYKILQKYPSFDFIQESFPLKIK